MAWGSSYQTVYCTFTSSHSFISSPHPSHIHTFGAQCPSALLENATVCNRSRKVKIAPSQFNLSLSAWRQRSLRKVPPACLRPSATIAYYKPRQGSQHKVNTCPEQVVLYIPHQKQRQTRSACCSQFQLLRAVSAYMSTLWANNKTTVQRWSI